MTQILLADDNDQVRKALRRVVEERTSWKVFAEARDGVEAIAIAKASCPDLALLDLSMPRMNGIEAAREIIALCPNVLVLVNSLHEATIVKPILQRAGVKGFVNKMNIASELVPAMEAVLNGGTWFKDYGGTTERVN